MSLSKNVSSWNKRPMTAPAPAVVEFQSRSESASPIVPMMQASPYSTASGITWVTSASGLGDSSFFPQLMLSIIEKVKGKQGKAQSKRRECKPPPVDAQRLHAVFD